MEGPFNCCVCGQNTHKGPSDTTLIPRRCLARNGYRGHRLCDECWFGEFAREGVTHDCPGCKKHLPLNPYSFRSETIDLSSPKRKSRKRKRKSKSLKTK